MPPLEVYETDDSTLVTDLAITAFEAGLDSDTLTVHVWNSIGDGTGGDVLNLLLVLRTEDPTAAGVFLASGVPPQDELWGSYRIVGFDNTGDPTFSTPNTDFRPVGSFSGLLVAEIPADCAVFLEIKMHPPSSAQVDTWRFQVVGIYNEFSQPIPPSVSFTERGILHGVGDYGHSGLFRGCEVSVSGPADDEVHTDAGTWTYLGIMFGKITEDHQLDQDDDAAATLIATESYWAVLTLGTGVTVTKGLKGTTPVRPTPPAGEIFLSFVQVDFQGGGTSIIEAADLDGDILFDRHLIVPDSTGLNLVMHPGQAIGGSTWRFRAGLVTLTMVASSTNYLWQVPSGNFAVTQTETPPDQGALGPWWEVVTDGSDITSVLDRRAYVGRHRSIILGGELPGSPGIIDAQLVEERLFIEFVALIVNDSGTSGETKVNIDLNGATIFTSFATEDQRPTVVNGDPDLRDDAAIPEVLELKYGDLLELETISHASSPVPDFLRCALLCRVP